MRLVDDLDGLGAQGLLVTAPVMPTEQQVGAPRKDDADIRLRIAAITTICRSERWGGERRCHRVLPFLLDESCVE